MTLKQFIEVLEATAAKQAAVATIVPQDVYRLNSMPNAKYGVFSWLHGQHEEAIGGSEREYRFTLFYVDRLTEDRGNLLDVQSVGVETLSNILRTLVADYPDEVALVQSVAYHPFTEKFVDECAGIYADVAVAVALDDICEEL